MSRSMIAPAAKRTLVAAIVTGIVSGCAIAGSTTAPGATSQGQPPQPTPTLAPAPSASVWTGLASGPFVVTGGDDSAQVMLNIASPGWTHHYHSGLDVDYVNKNDDGLDPPESVGATLLVWAWPAGTGFNVHGDPCHGSTTIPETPARTHDEIAAALAAQASSGATMPVDVTVGGFAGKAITLHVPMSFDLPNASREEKFADCDENVFAFYGVEGEPEAARNAQGAGQIDELWILDVDGSIVILDAALSPATPADLVEEVQALAASATFEAP